MLDEILARIDALHALDPELEAGVPRELLRARRMSEVLARLVPGASDALRIAVRAQHLERWTFPRASRPDGRAGYLAWRTEAAERHAARVGEVLASCGADEALIARVAELVQKKRLARDPEAQALEDCACLVFVEHELLDFVAKERGRGTPDAELLPIVQKTWRKMSASAREAALSLVLPDDARALLSLALGAAPAAPPGGAAVE